LILVTLTAATDAAGTLSNFYVSTGRFVTAPADTPANIAFEPCIIDPGSIGLHAYSDGRTGGASRLEIGEIVISNAGGQFDDWITYSFDGRDVVIRSGEEGGAYPADFPAVFIGTVESVEADWSRIIVRLRDKQWKFRLPALTTTYAGNNSLPNGLEGTASDLKGKVKPKVYGQVFNASAPCVNTSKLTYQVSNGAVNSIDAVYDNGVALTPGTDHANSTLLQAATPAASSFDTCKAEGYFRLGTSPVGQITADVTQGSTSGARTVAQILRQLALDAGISSGDISSADVTALDTANSSVVGIYIDDSGATFSSAMDMVAASVGAFYGFDSAGVFRMGRLTAPSGTAVTTLYDYDIFDNIERRPAKDTGLPIWSTTVRHSKIFTVQNSGIASSVTAARRAYLAEEYRAENSVDASIKTQWLLAETLEVDGLLTVAADAATEVSRLLTLFKVRRDIFDVTVDLSVVTDNGLEMLDVVGVVLSRFGLSGGKSFRIIGMAYDLEKNICVLSLWG
jgi:hypothetical protein